MDNYVITCCSTVDLTKEQLEAVNVKYICFNFELDGVPRKDDLYTSISPNELYTAMANGSDTKTSQVSIGEYIDFFTPFLKEGKDILHICLSSGISGTYNSALLAKEQLNEEFPDRKIYIVDSLAASSGYGLLVTETAYQRDNGLDIEALYKWIEDKIKYIYRKKPVNGGKTERIVLDAIIDIKTIPDTTIEKTINQIKILIKNNKVNLKSLVKSAFFETTRVKSVIGAIAEEFDFENDLLNKLKNSLNPLSMVYLNVGNALMYANNWQIRADRK